MDPVKAVLIFDGDCGFCRYWIARWRVRTAGQVEFLPFQDPSVTVRFPNVSVERSRRAVQLVTSEGEVFEGAHAVFRLLAITGPRWPLMAYRQVPFVSGIAERAYRLIAGHRPLFSRLTRWLWGRDPAPSTYAFANWLFLRLLGIVYLAAFWSLATQIRGLVGVHGIEPASVLLLRVRSAADAQGMGIERYLAFPTLCWLSASDRMLEGLCVAGAVLSVPLIGGVASVVILPLLWAIYLSLTTVTGDFLAFQWDALLLESGILAILLAPATLLHRPSEAVPSRGARWLIWWLLFRLMFGSGLAKLVSGDPTWRSLAALSFHYETQPLPTIVGWYAHHLPLWFQRVSTGAVLVIELVGPWLIAAPRRLRLFACASFVVLQLAIALTGNYAFFNLLAIALALTLVDDATWEQLGIGRIRTWSTGGLNRPTVWRRMAVTIAAVVIVPVSLLVIGAQARVAIPGAELVAPLYDAIAPLRSVNAYALFSVMTTTRPELVIQGSDDGQAWREYEFGYKPGDLRRAPRWAAPHQPRLDWQMWFAALGEYGHDPWLESFCRRLLEGSPDVVALLAVNPFADRPPRYVRALRYRYEIPALDAHREMGMWWVRSGGEPYSPVFTLPQR